MAQNYIEAIRKRKGISREALAESIQKSPLTVWRYENEKSAITDTVLHLIAKALDVRVAELIEEPVASYAEEDIRA